MQPAQPADPQASAQPGAAPPPAGPGRLPGSAFPAPSATLQVDTNGDDSVSCGLPTSPCRTLAYTVNHRVGLVRAGSPEQARHLPAQGASRLGPADVVEVVMGPGLYGAASCGARAYHPLIVRGVGSQPNGTFVNCGGLGRLLLTNARCRDSVRTCAPPQPPPFMCRLTTK